MRCCLHNEHSISAEVCIDRTHAPCTIATQARERPQLSQPLSCRDPKRATMATPAHELEEKRAIVKKKRASGEQAPMPAKTRRIVNAAQLVYQSLGPLPPPNRVNMLGSQAHQLVPWTRSRTDVCKFAFWFAHLGNVCSRLRLVQANWRQGVIQCRVESQRRGTLHLHCLCYVPQGVLELPPSDGSYRAARKRPRDAESPDARPNHITTAA